MIEAMVKKTERLSKRKSLKNMQYSDAFGQLCDILGTISPSLYRTFRHHFGGPAIRSMRFVNLRLFSTNPID